MNGNVIFYDFELFESDSFAQNFYQYQVINSNGNILSKIDYVFIGSADEILQKIGVLISDNIKKQSTSEVYNQL